MTSPNRETVHEIIDHMGEQVPEAMKQKTEEAVVRLLEDPTVLPKDVLGYNPYMLERMYEYGYQLFQNGKYEDAIKAFIFLRQLDPPNVTYSFGIAACYHYMKKYEDAAGNYMICTVFEPTNPIYYFHMYDCFIKQNYVNSALKTLKKTITTADDPKYSELKHRATMKYKHLKNEIKKSNKMNETLKETL